MTSLSIHTSMLRGANLNGGMLVRAIIVLGVLLFAVAVEVTAENSFDPQHRLSAADMTAQP